MELKQTATKTGKRLSKYKREAEAVPHVLTDRDMAIVAAVADYRLLSRSQIQRLLGFGATTRVNFRLQKLFHHGYLQRHYLPTVHGSSQAIYRLDRAGVSVAALRLGAETEAFWRPKHQHLKPLFLAHQLALNEIRIAFALSARAHTDHKLAQWCPEDIARDRFFTGADWQTLTPDASGQYLAGARALTFFVEADQGTMSGRRFQEKVGRYTAYIASGRFAEKYQRKRFRVLVVTSSAARIANLRRATGVVTNQLFWFATLDQLRTFGPFGPIWNVVGVRGNQSLLASDPQIGWAGEVGKSTIGSR